MSNESDYVPSAHLLFSYIVMSPNHGHLIQYYTGVKCLAVLHSHQCNDTFIILCDVKLTWLSGTVRDKNVIPSIIAC